ncbi:MAG: hypothetical protein ACD_62C00204G0001 [uncultured bacterium]|nr:MAG: hypothetical protein ACD_62C00204G0001 [uncultured bacterium]
MKNNTQPKYLKIILATVIAFYSTACDQNIVSPVDLTVDTSISIATFTVTDNIIEQETTVTLNWNVTDTYGKVSYCQLTTEAGEATVACTDGSKTITPSKTTVYTLTVFSDGDAIRAKSLQVTVCAKIGENGVCENELTETPVDEICNDTIDNDFNGTADCDDDACAEDATCLPVEPVYEFTTEPSVTPDPAVIGEPFIVAWAGTFAQVNLTCLQCDVEDFPVDFDGGDGSFTCTIISEADSVSIVVSLFGLDTEGVVKDARTLTLTANKPVPVPEPEFEADINKFSTSPSTQMFYGEEYTLSWDVTDAVDVFLDGAEVDHENQSRNYTAGIDPQASSTSYTHKLVVTDENNLTRTREKTITIAKFVSQGTYLAADVVDYVRGASETENYLITRTAVYRAPDAFGVEAEQVVSIDELNADTVEHNNKDMTDAGEIYSFLATSNGDYYIGTNQALYLKTGSTVKEIAKTSGLATVKAIAETSQGIYAATDRELFKVDVSEPNPNGLGAFPTENYPNSDSYVDFYQLITNPENNNQVLAITAEGVYFVDFADAENYSDKKFKTAATKDKDINKGNWSFDDSLLVWSNNIVYQWDGSALLEKIDIDDENIFINYVVKEGGRYLLATTSGIICLNAGSKLFNTNLMSNTLYLATGSVNDVADSGTPGTPLTSMSLGALGKNTVHAIAEGGNRYKIEWQDAAFMLAPTPSINFPKMPVINSEIMQKLFNK